MINTRLERSGSNFVICRIIGNELPPRDIPGSKLDSLQFILNSEPLVRADSLWLLNHLHDENYRARVLELLNHAAFYEIRFDPDHYRLLKTRRDRIRYAININGARNHGIRIAAWRYDFIACLDQDCFFTPSLWQQVLACVTQDQQDHSDRQYYGLIMKRLLSYASCDLSTLWNHEPQLIFRRDATRLFDPGLPFGAGDKALLLHYLGYGGPPLFSLCGHLCRTAGFVLHAPAGPVEAELDFATRSRLRSESIDRLLQTLAAVR